MMNLLASIFWTILAAIFLAGEITARGSKCTSQTSLATFNVGLVPFFSEDGGAIEERTALLIEEIRSSNIDIFCLQEVFFANIQRQVYRELKDAYPYAVTATDLTVDDSDPTPACTLSQLQLFGTCLAVQCPNLQGAQLFACAVVSCSNLLDTQQCLDCVSLYIQAQEGIGGCAVFPASRFERNYGLMIISRKKLTNTRASGYSNQSQFDGYLEASVAGVGDLICTHLSSIESTEVYYGPPIVVPLLYTTYEEQQYNEVLTLLELVTTKETPILMGDLNNGPASPGRRWAQPFHYGLISARGFISPYIQEDGRCSVCTENPAVVRGNGIVDHILITTDSYKGRVVSSRRILDNSVTGSGVSLSDHYGVRLTLKDTLSDCRWWQRRRYYCPAEPGLQLLPLPAPQPELTRLCIATTLP